MKSNTVFQLYPGQYAERTQLVDENSSSVYAHIVGDLNPLHFDNAFAAENRLEKKIAPGILLAGFISGIIGTELPGAGTLYESQTLSFLHPVFYGDIITTCVKVCSVDMLRNRARLKTKCTNQNGICVLKGESVVLPRRSNIMYLSNIMPKIGCDYTLLSDGEFSVLEQCTRIRARKALTYLENPKYIKALSEKNISCVICSPEVQNLLPSHIQGVVLTNEPKSLFFQLHTLLLKNSESIPTFIDPTARVSPQAYVAPYGVVIGKHTEVQPFAVIGEGTILEDNVRICCGTVIGGQSFTSVREGESGFLVPDAGRVRIEKGVEICPNCHVARGTLQLDETILGAYSKLDAMVHIGHGSVVGKQTLFAAGATISGNCTIGDRVWIGVNATVSNRIVIGDEARISLGSVVTKDVPNGEIVTGNFAIPHRIFMRNLKASLVENTVDNQTSFPMDTLGVPKTCSNAT